MGEVEAPVDTPAPAATDDFDALFAMLEEPAAPAAEAAPAEWIVTVYPGPRAFDHGAEPMLALRELSRMGGRTLSADLSDLPLLDGLDAERAYMGFTLALPGTTDEDDIRAVFDFADPQCRLTVTRATEDGDKSADRRHGLTGFERGGKECHARAATRQSGAFPVAMPAADMADGAWPFPRSPTTLAEAF